MGAITENRIRLEYQHVLVPGDGIARYEALARIVEPDITGGAFGDRLIPAGLWIEAVYSSERLARAFDWHVIELVFAAGIQPGQQIWINATMHTIKQIAFPSQLGELMERYNIASHQIAIEATEQSAGNGEAFNLAKLANQMGVAVVVDDLGSGYCNLWALSRLPLSAIKIDGALIKAYRSEHAADVIQSLAVLAKKWGVLCVAEWVEDSGQKETLQSWGITGFQGWAIK